MKVAYHKIPIPVQLPCHMEGYVDRVSSKIHDHPQLVSFILQGETTIVYHVLDVILIEKELANRLQNAINQKFQIPIEQVFIAATHTHSSVKISNYLLPSYPPEAELLDKIEELVLENTAICLANLKESQANYREISTGHLYSNRNDPSHPFNDKAYAIRFEDTNQQPIFELVNIACHPTVLAPEVTEISRDYVGVLRDDYEKATGVPLAVLIGEAGDVSTRHTRKGQDFSEVERVGKIISQLLQNEKNSHLLDLSGMHLRQKTVEFTYKPQEDQDLLMTRKLYQEQLKNLEGSKQGEIISDFLRMIDKKLQKESLTLTVPISVLDCKDWQILQFPSEILSDFGLKIREQSQKKQAIHAYTNGFMGYAVPEHLYGKVYESAVSEFPRGIADQLIEQLITLSK
ncbi:TPA: hypothetical protein VVL78_001343 [Streptococcus pneumoniae]|nr:hypothetical protein [Streptococcus pneumoniae]